MKKGTKNKPYWKLIDEFSGYLLKEDMDDTEKYKVKSERELMTAQELIDEIGPFVPEYEPESFDE